jgi:hypothetical protein
MKGKKMNSQNLNRPRKLNLSEGISEYVYDNVQMQIAKKAAFGSVLSASDITFFRDVSGGIRKTNLKASGKLDFGFAIDIIQLSPQIKNLVIGHKADGVNSDGDNGHYFTDAGGAGVYLADVNPLFDWLKQKMYGIIVNNARLTIKVKNTDYLQTPLSDCSPSVIALNDFGMVKYTSDGGGLILPKPIEILTENTFDFDVVLDKSTIETEFATLCQHMAATNPFQYMFKQGGTPYPPQGWYSYLSLEADLNFAIVLKGVAERNVR